MPDFMLFEYDRFDPLDTQVSNSQKSDGVTIQDLSYASPKGGRVPAYLVLPVGHGPFPAVVFMHWGQGDRNEFLQEAMALAGTGAVSLCLDGPFARAEKPQGDHAQVLEQTLIQGVVDVRRGVDLLMERTDVDSQRAAYVGHSYGATIGGLLAAVEKRVHLYVLMGGSPSLSESYRTSQHPGMVQMRQEILTDELQRMTDTIAPLDADQYVAYAAPSALLFQFARQDEYISEEEANRFFNAASDPKTMKWYDGGHEFNAEARRDRVEWLCRQLSVPVVESAVLEKIQ